MNPKIISAVIAAFITLAVPGQSLAALTRIGAAGGVSGRVTAEAAGAAVRTLSGGQTVYFKDKVITSAQGRLQVLLLDQTVFTMGPNGEMILDEFVYDPFTQTGKVSAKITKGVFRFVTGKIARKQPSSMKVELPSGTIGIRGTIAAGSVGPNGSLVALLGPGPNNNANEKPGAIEVSNAGVTVQITRPGYATEIRGADLPPTTPAPLTPAQLAGLDTTPPAAAGDGDEPGGDNTAANESGQDTAGAGGDLTATQTTGGLQEELGEDVTNGVQSTGMTDGTASTWDQMAASINTGTGYWDFSGVSFTCAGSCGSGPNSASMWLYVNWGTREFTSGGVSLSGAITASDSFASPVAFGTGGDPAVFDYISDGGMANTDFSGTKASFENKNGAAGGQAKFNLNYNNGSASTSVEHTSPFTPN